MGKRQSVITVASRGMAGCVFKFANGKILTITPAELGQAVRDAATVHGIVQKVVDAAALSRDTETGKPATVDEKFAACAAIVKRLTEGGPWNDRTAGPRGILFRALCEVYAGKKTPEQIAAFLAEKSAGDKAALARNPKVKPVYDRLMAEAAAGDGEEQLAELEDEAGAEAAGDAAE